MPTSHAPAPWIVTHRRVIERPVRIREHFAIAPAGGPTFAFLPEGRVDIQAANARLIAAAPYLLEACQTLIKYCSLRDGSLGQYADWIQTFVEDGSTIFEAVEMAAAAIAKAEGRA